MVAKLRTDLAVRRDTTGVVAGCRRNQTWTQDGQDAQQTGRWTLQPAKFDAAASDADAYTSAVTRAPLDGRFWRLVDSRNRRDR